MSKYAELCNEKLLRKWRLEEQLSAKEIAIKIKCNVSDVYNTLYKFKILKGNKKYHQLYDYDFLYNKCVIEKLTHTEIANISI